MTERMTVELDYRTCQALTTLVYRHLEDIEGLHGEKVEAERLWAMWLTLVLAPPVVSESVLKAGALLIEDLRGAVSSVLFDEATGSHRSDLPPSWGSALPRWLSGRLASSGQPEGTNEPSGASKKS